MFLNSTNFAYASQLGKENLVYDYIFTSQTESNSALDMDAFASPLLILSHMELFSIELPRLTSGILLKVVTIPVLLGDQFYFYMHQPIKPWFLKKIIFELHYHWASLFLCLVLKSLVSY